MWRQRLLIVLRTITVFLVFSVYLTGYVVLEAGVHVVGAIAGLSVAAAALVCIALGRARFMYLALPFYCVGSGLFPFTLFGVPFDAFAVPMAVVVGVTTIVYGAAELRAEAGEPFRDPVGLLLDGGHDDELDDAIHVPSAHVIASDRYAATKNRNDPDPVAR